MGQELLSNDLMAYCSGSRNVNLMEFSIVGDFVIAFTPGAPALFFKLVHYIEYVSFLGREGIGGDFIEQALLVPCKPGEHRFEVGVEQHARGRHQDGAEGPRDCLDKGNQDFDFFFLVYKRLVLLFFLGVFLLFLRHSALLLALLLQTALRLFFLILDFLDDLLFSFILQ